MPYKSQAQRSWMHANKPEMAKKWDKETPKGKKLPRTVKGTNTTKDKAIREAVKKVAQKRKPK